MVSFLEDVPDYRSLQSSIYFVSEAPEGIWNKLEAYAVKASHEDSLKSIVNRINEIALIPPTTNWGYDWLKQDLSNTIWEIKKQVEKGKFHILMDTLSAVVELGKIDIDEINDFLIEYKIGYSLAYEGFFRNYFWEVRENIDDLTYKIEATTQIVKSESQQALEHLEQAKNQLTNVSNERARKDAVRDCASALETIIKLYGGKNDIRVASQELRNEKVWGKDEIVKEGDAIFNLLHRLYPDLRHGSIERSNMSLNEARYWVDRITTYIDYMVRQKDILGKKL